jgi:CheY-like chemotaxis protein
VLTDVKMPGLDGFELAKALRDDVRTRQVPLIFLSGETGTGNRARADELGALRSRALGGVDRGFVNPKNARPRDMFRTTGRPVS